MTDGKRDPFNKSDALKFWGLEHSLFHESSKNNSIYVSNALGPIVERLLIFCQRPKTLNLLTAPPGAGKSSLARWTAQQLDYASHECLLFSLARGTQENSWLSSQILAFFDTQKVKSERTGQDILTATASALDQLIDEQRQLLVIIDDAHHISEIGGFEEIEALLNLQALAGSCLSFLLLGSEELTTKIRNRLSLQSSISFLAEIPLLGKTDVFSYIDWHIKKSTMPVNPFSREITDQIWELSHSNLGTINNLVDACLVESALTSEKAISFQCLDTVAKHLGINRTEVLSIEPNDFVDGKGLTALKTLPTSEAHSSFAHEETKTMFNADSLFSELAPQPAEAPQKTPIVESTNKPQTDKTEDDLPMKRKNARTIKSLFLSDNLQSKTTDKTP